MERYLKIREIGSGAYGTAVLCKNRATNEQCVIKIMKLSCLPPDARVAARKEVGVLANLKHRNIVRYFDSFEENGYLCIVMEYCDGSDLDSKINPKTGPPLSEKQIWDFIVQITMALKYLHGKKVLHRDIKPSNIFLTRKGEVKLGDFGVAKTLNHTLEMATTFAGTPAYLAPEICEGKTYNEKCDIWSLGCMIYEMATNRIPFIAGSIVELGLKIINTPHSQLPRKYSPELGTLVDELLRKDPALRPSAAEILRKPIVKTVCRRFLSDRELSAEFKPSEHAPQQRHSPGLAAGKHRPVLGNIGNENVPSFGSMPQPIDSLQLAKDRFEKQNFPPGHQRPVRLDSGRQSPPPARFNRYDEDVPRFPVLRVPQPVDPVRVIPVRRLPVDYTDSSGDIGAYQKPRAAHRSPGRFFEHLKPLFNFGASKKPRVEPERPKFDQNDHHGGTKSLPELLGDFYEDFPDGYDVPSPKYPKNAEPPPVDRSSKPEAMKEKTMYEELLELAYLDIDNIDFTEERVRGDDDLPPTKEEDTPAEPSAPENVEAEPTAPDLTDLNEPWAIGFENFSDFPLAYNTASALPSHGPNGIDETFSPTDIDGLLDTLTEGDVYKDTLVGPTEHPADPDVEEVVGLGCISIEEILEKEKTLITDRDGDDSDGDDNIATIFTPPSPGQQPKKTDLYDELLAIELHKRELEKLEHSAK